jgi:hypothetical protein
VRLREWVRVGMGYAWCVVCQAVYDQTGLPTRCCRRCGCRCAGPQVTHACRLLASQVHDSCALSCTHALTPVLTLCRRIRPPTAAPITNIRAWRVVGTCDERIRFVRIISTHTSQPFYTHQPRRPQAVPRPQDSHIQAD